MALIRIAESDELGFSGDIKQAWDIMCKKFLGKQQFFKPMYNIYVIYRLKKKDSMFLVYPERIYGDNGVKASNGKFEKINPFSIDMSTDTCEPEQYKRFESAAKTADRNLTTAYRNITNKIAPIDHLILSKHRFLHDEITEWIQNSCPRFEIDSEKLDYKLFLYFNTVRIACIAFSGICIDLLGIGENEKIYFAVLNYNTGEKWVFTENPTYVRVRKESTKNIQRAKEAYFPNCEKDNIIGEEITQSNIDRMMQVLKPFTDAVNAM